MDSTNTFIICATILGLAGIGANLIAKTRRPAKTWMCVGRRVVDGEWHDHEYGPFMKRDAADRFRYGWLLNESESAFMMVDEVPAAQSPSIGGSALKAPTTVDRSAP